MVTPHTHKVEHIMEMVFHDWIGNTGFRDNRINRFLTGMTGVSEKIVFVPHSNIFGTEVLLHPFPIPRSHIFDQIF